MPSTGQTYGSEQQVVGKIGAEQEEPPKVLTKADQEATEPSVKGAFDTTPFHISLIPSLLLLLLVVYLAVKLHFTEKRRQLEIVRLFDDHLGTLSSLESKTDLLTQKNEESRERYIQELEDAKKQMLEEAKVNAPKAASQ
ncbi:MAG: hypothetical protein BWY68_00627 [bacterium ADurb.Bin400]|nr:MAG: hypothetical protein BWY68_00627 [bacterium ADurb.Bin400]